MKPSRIEYERARDLGESARRAGRPASANPFKEDYTERGQILAEAWHEAWALPDRRRA
jgi:hypothetical protein